MILLYGPFMVAAEILGDLRLVWYMGRELVVFDVDSRGRMIVHSVVSSKCTLFCHSAICFLHLLVNCHSSEDGGLTDKTFVFSCCCVIVPLRCHPCSLKGLSSDHAVHSIVDALCSLLFKAVPLQVRVFCFDQKWLTAVLAFKILAWCSLVLLHLTWYVKKEGKGQGDDDLRNIEWDCRIYSRGWEDQVKVLEVNV